MATKRGSKKRKKSRSVTIDLSGIEGRVLLPEEDYLVTIDEITEKDGTEATFLEWKFKTIDDDKKLNDVTVTYNTSLAPQSLWNLRNLLEAIGVDIPDNEFDLELDEITGEEVVITIGHEKYEGRNVMKVTDFYSTDDIPSEESSKKVEVNDDEKSDKKKTTEKDDDKYTAEEVGDMDKKELQELVDDHDLDINLDTLRTLRKRVAAVIDALEEKDLLED